MNLDFEEGSLSGVILFYSIVHLNYTEIEKVFAEINRSLEIDGLLFLAFHAGDSVLHVDDFFEQKVDLDYMFLDTDRIVDILIKTGFKLEEALTRYPYEGAEYSSKRGYVLCRKDQ